MSQSATLEKPSVYNQTTLNMLTRLTFCFTRYGLRLTVQAVLLAAAAHSSMGSLLVYEGFNGYSGNLSTATPNANTIGLNQSTAYGGSGVANFTINGSSLAFGSQFVTSGGSVTTTSGTAVAAAALSLSVTPYVGTLYNSYLVNLTSRGALTGDGSLGRIASNNSNSNERFLSLADSRNNTTNVGAGYDGTVAGSSVTLGLGTTYLMIARYNSVGSSLATNGGNGTVYALTLSQYESFVAAGRTDSYLDSAGIGGTATEITARISDTSTTSGTYSFATGSFAQFVSVGNVTIFDEMRYGTTLLDVTPIPEPSSTALLALGCGLFFTIRRCFFCA